MADEEPGKPDPLNEKAKPPRRWAAQAVVVVAVIAGGIISGAKIWQPVKKVEQKVAAPIREAVKRRSPLEELPNMVDDACPAVVALHLDGVDGPPAQAVLLTQEGYAVTTATLAPEAVFQAWLNDGQRLKATVAATDPISGISLLKVAGDNLPVADLGDADLPRIGAWGFSLMSPVGRGCVAQSGLVTSDFVTDGATGDYYIRVRAGSDLPPAGTPFFSPEGRVVGLARAADAKGTPSDHVVPVDLVTTVISYLMHGTPSPAARYGLIIEDPSPELADRLGADRGRGAVIVMIAPNSAAAKSGLQIGDVILSAGQSPISSASEFNRKLGGNNPIDLVVTRGPDQTTQTLTLTPPA